MSRSDDRRIGAGLVDKGHVAMTCCRYATPGSSPGSRPSWTRAVTIDFLLEACNRCQARASVADLQIVRASNALRPNRHRSLSAGVCRCPAVSCSSRRSRRFCCLRDKLGETDLAIVVGVVLCQYYLELSIGDVDPRYMEQGLQLVSLDSSVVVRIKCCEQCDVGLDVLV